ncbi:Pvc16 family protein [Streptomyces sp. NPDC051014]|uniref:Pvc16 family protein n=1 Tax=Streptomyces sp. NPDC051014 TaxID=3155751 RepID=UPI0033C11E54
MIDAVTLSLESWLRRCVPTAELWFDSPARGFSGDPTQSVVRAFLYDVREEENGRVGSFYVRDASNKVVARSQPSRLFQYSYELTAYAADWQECYRLLGEIMRTASQVSALPDEDLHPSFAGFRSGAVRLMPAPFDPVPVPWSAARVPDSPVLHLAVIAPMPFDSDEELEPAPERVEIGMGRGSFAAPPAGEIPRRESRSARGRIEE